MAQHRIIAASEGFDQRPLGVIHPVGQFVQPFRAGGKKLTVGTVHRKAKMVDTLWRADHTFAHHTVTTRQTLDVAPNLDHLAHPFMTGRHRIRDWDDVIARQKFIIRMANAHAARADHHLVVSDRRYRHVGDDRLVRLIEDKGFHLGPRKSVWFRPRLRCGHCGPRRIPLPATQYC